MAVGSVGGGGDKIAVKREVSRAEIPKMQSGSASFASNSGVKNIQQHEKASDSRSNGLAVQSKRDSTPEKVSSFHAVA